MIKSLKALNLLVASSLLLMPFSASAVAHVSLAPALVARGGTMEIAVKPNQNYINNLFWITKGKSETALATGVFPCYQVCYYPISVHFTVPSTWAESSDYYVKIYDRSINNYIKTNFSVQGQIISQDMSASRQGQTL